MGPEYRASLAVYYLKTDMVNSLCCSSLGGTKRYFWHVFLFLDEIPEQWNLLESVNDFLVPHLAPWTG